MQAQANNAQSDLWNVKKYWQLTFSSAMADYD